MERKRIFASASLLMVLLASFALFPPGSSQDQDLNHRYIVMGGYAKGCSDLVAQPSTVNWKTPFQTRPPDFWPKSMEQNISFSDPWFYNDTYGWLVNITIPYQTYIGLEHAWYDQPSQTWYRLTVTMEQDAHGWIFLNASKGDVDCYTYNTDDGVYWHTPSGVSSTDRDSHVVPAPSGASPKTGTKAAGTGALPDVGSDGVGGTADDGFGNGALDPAGSSIVLVPTTMHVDFWTGSAWTLLFESPWPQVLTTANVYDIVIENPPDNELDGWNVTETGKPWEFLAGLDQAGQGPVPYGHDKWNAYVTYVCAWSVIDQATALGELDVIFAIKEKKVREDVVISDADCNQLVNILDILVAAVAFGCNDEKFGNPVADPKYDARADFDGNGLTSYVRSSQPKKQTRGRKLLNPPFCRVENSSTV